MAASSSWHHIPVHSISEDDLVDVDPFGENPETTFPPLRYMPLFYDHGQAAFPNVNSVHRLRRESSRERDRLYRELVGHAPYRPLATQGRHFLPMNSNYDENNRFQIRLDVKHYLPDEVTLKVDGKSLVISAKHYNQSSNGFESSEFQRKYTIPDDVNTHTLTSNITPDGVLFVEGARINRSTTRASLSVSKRGESTSSFGSVEIKTDAFEVTLEVGGYAPDEISVHLNNNRELVVHGERKNEIRHDDATVVGELGAGVVGKSVYHEQFTRTFELPDDADADALSSRFTHGKIVVVAPRRQRSALDSTDDKSTTLTEEGLQNSSP